MSFALGMLGTSVPFVISAMGGSDKHVGLCSGLAFLSYVTTCLAWGPFVDRFNSKDISKIGGAGMAFSTFAMVMLVGSGVDSLGPVSNVWLFLIFAMSNGFFMSSWWPPIMGWISTGHESHSLGKRLGGYNICWTMGLTLSPVFAGLILEHSHFATLLTLSCFALTAFISVLTAPKPLKQVELNDKQPQDNGFVNHPRLKAFRRMARIALISVFICVSISKTQLALLFKYNLGFTESQFGMATTARYFLTAFTFFILGRTQRWHYNRKIFFSAHLLAITSMVIIIFGSHNSSGLWLFCAALFFLGVAKPILFQSHQYYAVSGSNKRSRQMAIHEVLLGTGFGIGSIGGGYIAELFGRSYAPYIFAVSIVVSAIAIEAITWHVTKKDQPQSQPTDSQLKS